MEALIANVSATCPLPFSGSTGHLFARAIATVVAAHCTIFDDYQWPMDNAQEILSTGPKSFDFIVVGAGTAGSALSGQLAELDPGPSVLLIEAGDNPSLNSEIPAFLISNQDIDWRYETISKEACLAFNNNMCVWNKGKAIGGSSSINAMLYVRGHPRDYERWKDLGNAGWGYEDLLPYFKRIETKLNLSSYEYHENPWYNILESSYSDCGIQKPKIDDNEGLIGTRITKLLTHNGKRLNTAKIHLKKVNNLYVVKNSLVQKVIIDGNTKIASGVELRHKSGVVMQIKANKEVILSAGSIATPQILMLSGIGPKSHLEELGIECLHNASVGKNLQDHIIFPLFFKTNVETEIPDESVILSWLQYMLTKKGPLSNIGLTDFMAFIDTKNISNQPDIQYHHLYFTKNDKFMIRSYLEGYGYKDDIVQIIEKLNKNSDLLGIYPTLLHPKSSGEILLRNSDITSAPKIVTNYFEDWDDIKTLVRAIEFVQRLEETNTFKSLGIKLVPLKLPGCVRFQFMTEGYWECYIRHMATTVYHPVGTAKMGIKEDGTAVVDNNLLVHGTVNLRVVDASVMPTITGGNTMAPTLVIAEKAADIIKTKYYRGKDEL